jgi:hypothetical protein
VLGVIIKRKLNALVYEAWRPLNTYHLKWQPQEDEHVQSDSGSFALSPKNTEYIWSCPCFEKALGQRGLNHKLPHFVLHCIHTYQKSSLPCCPRDQGATDRAKLSRNARASGVALVSGVNSKSLPSIRLLLPLLLH